MMELRFEDLDWIWIGYFSVLVSKRIYVNFFVQYIAFKLYRDDICILQRKTNSSTYFLGTFKIFNHFQYLGCVGHIANSLLIRVFFHQFSVHISKIYWLYGSFVAQCSLTPMSFHTMGIRLKTWICYHVLY